MLKCSINSSKPTIRDVRTKFLQQHGPVSAATADFVFARINFLDYDADQHH